MARNIVLLFDGTSNEIGADRTNVLRLYGALKRDATQLVWYDPGVGTLGRHYITRLATKAYEIAGLALGLGLDDNVKEAYRHLVQHWRKGDRICIFGFSRGAYTARVLVGFLNAIGIIEPAQMNLLDYAWREYKRIEQDGSFERIRMYDNLLRPERIVPVHFLGLFDTVASVITFDRLVPRLQYLPFTAGSRLVETVRHAVALDERRRMFMPQLWKKGLKFEPNPYVRDDAKSPPQDVKELWFRGTHCDIGGGWPEEKSALAKVTLEWMVGEAKKAGLQFSSTTVDSVILGSKPGRDGKRYARPDPNAAVNPSLKGLWWLIECLPRRRGPLTSRFAARYPWYIPFGERRKLPADGCRYLPPAGVN
jgi:uncharacterized protein (DUF2235 family)